MMNFILATQNNWLLYLLGSLVVLLSLLVCVLIIYITALRSGSVEKAKAKLPETEGDKNSNFGTDPESLNKNRLQVIEDKKTNGYIVKMKGKKESIAYAKTKEEANEIAANLSKQESSSNDSLNVDVQNRKGVDGEMVSYINDRSTHM